VSLVYKQLIPRLQQYEKPSRAFGEVTHRAAVAIVLHECDDELCLLIALDLDALGHEVCALGDVNTGWRADRPEMLVAPFIYRVEQLPALDLNYEVDGVISVPLSFLMDRSNRVPLKWEWRGTQVESDSYLYQDSRIWGLSLMMIDELIEAVER